MTEKDWDLIDYFTPSENWGNPSLIVPELVTLLDKLRDFIKTPIVINCGTQGIHAVDSLHEHGRAVDCLIPGVKALDAWIAAMRFPFTGIGFYPEWRMDKEMVGGLHLEVDNKNIGYKKLWMGLGVAQFDTKYVAMDETNIQVHYLLSPAKIQ